MNLGTFLTFVFFYTQLGVQAQLKCKTIKTTFGDSTICFHQSGSISTIEFNDRENDRYKQFFTFDVNGNKIFEGGHGYRHGGGSLDVKYYSNGCVSSIRSTFQPDGGIQHYDATTYYNEDGTFNRKEDNSWDRMLIHEPLYTPTHQPTKIQDVKIDTFSVQILNLSAFSQRILIIDVKNPENNKIVKIKKNQKVEVGTFISENLKSEINASYKFEVLPHKKNELVRIQSLDVLLCQNEIVLIIIPDSKSYTLN